MLDAEAALEAAKLAAETAAAAAARACVVIQPKAEATLANTGVDSRAAIPAGIAMIIAGAMVARRRLF